MIVCKFNQSDPPDTILASGFDSFFEQILESGSDEVKMSIKTRIEEARHGVRVNAILPGHIVTELFLKEKERSADPEAYEARCNSYSWLGRGGTPEEIGKVALFLASSWAGFMTGASVMVSGGLEFGTMPKYYHFDATKE